MDKKITYYKCKSCNSKFKKECPPNIKLCSRIEKCPKCGNDLNALSKKYNQSKIEK